MSNILLKWSDRKTRLKNGVGTPDTIGNRRVFPGGPRNSENSEKMSPKNTSVPCGFSKMTSNSRAFGARPVGFEKFAIYKNFIKCDFFGSTFEKRDIFCQKKSSKKSSKNDPLDPGALSF